ncbi:MAG: hypothetical protein ACRBI6_21285, partial [Acidimicrobiales bacterium]
LYQCDDAEAWWFFRDEAALEEPGDATCSEGHEAVTLTKMRRADVVSVSLVPAARIADELTGKVWHEGRYLLAVSAFTGETRVAREELSWEEGARRMKFFEGLSASEAWSRWERLGLQVLYEADSGFIEFRDSP